MKYSIEGEPLPVVICEMEANEMMITEKGAMSWMSPNMKMETVGGGMGKMFGRMFSGESMFVNHYTAMGGPGMIAFASSFPGRLILSRDRISSARRRRFWRRLLKWSCPFSSRKKQVRAFSAARALLCRNCPATVWHL